MRTLIHMDDPQHRVVRAIGADWFRPKAMRALKIRVDELAKIYVDKMLAAGSECDFVQEVAMNYPLYVIMSLLGLPEWDFPRMLALTQELFGGDDEELNAAPRSKSSYRWYSNSSAISMRSPLAPRSADRGPGVRDRQCPVDGERCRTSIRVLLRIIARGSDTPARRSPAACTRSSKIPINESGCATTPI